MDDGQETGSQPDTMGRRSPPAQQLRVTRVTVLNRMRKYGIDLQRILRT